MKDLNELKEIINEKTGVPIQALTGNDERQIIDCARWILNEREKNLSETSYKSTRDQFADWMNSKNGESSENPHLAELSKIEEHLRVEAGGYPITEDSGDPYVNGRSMSDPRSAREQFAEWFQNKTAFDPFKENNDLI